MQALSNSFRKRANIWFEQTFTSRLNDQKKGAIIVVMQRLHVKDLTGFLLEKDPHNWQLLGLPLIAKMDEVVTHHNFSCKQKVGEYLHSNRDGEIESLKKAIGHICIFSTIPTKPHTN
ncbi:phage uncharacterized protein [Candidatus Midichloria mitochondrii IricVA]|uniref:Phage uncharacterized protein n=2 Tax=Candidatus Midichloria mitochondrii TaxID=234827 RepID=F7XTQ2_MIDMI|nr:phage uncharacterized protein [Candidatus Midichloria mitochondrii IricVA]